MERADHPTIAVESASALRGSVAEWLDITQGHRLFLHIEGIAEPWIVRRTAAEADVIGRIAQPQVERLATPPTRCRSRSATDSRCAPRVSTPQYLKARLTCPASISAQTQRVPAIG